MSFTEDVIEQLKKLGFNEYQAKIYTALVGLGVATASEISQASGVPPNKVYSVIDTLKKRGLVLAQESDTSTNRYRPRSPDNVIKDIRNDYETALQKTEEKLFALYERSKKAFIPEMWILRGSQAVFSKIKEMIMDANKAEKLRSIGYSISPACCDCNHSQFNNSSWGTCKIQTYQHLKHTDTARQLSIYIAGYCDKFEAKKSLDQTWEEFRA